MVQRICIVKYRSMYELNPCTAASVFHSSHKRWQGNREEAFRIGIVNRLRLKGQSHRQNVIGPSMFDCEVCLLNAEAATRTLIEANSNIT